jgi:predicted nucleic acid-binding protein
MQRRQPTSKLGRINSQQPGILPMDAATFRLWAKLMRRRSNPLIEDAMIAATAQLLDSRS